MLYKGAIHSSIGKGLTVLLPKIAEPQQWGDCRPITLSLGDWNVDCQT